MHAAMAGRDDVGQGMGTLPACQYAYDATGLLARITLADRSGERFWRGTYAANELRTSASSGAQLTWLRAVGQPIVEQVSGAVARMTLLATAISGSVLLEADTAVRAVAYAPHGSRPDGEQAVGAAEAEPAFNGELLDAASGCYLLGAGHHRPYSPRLGIFLAADRLSPFGAGGVNPYAYCAGDPVNRSDPTGHFWKWIVAAVGIAVGVAAVAVTFGAASKAVAAVATVGFSALTKSTAGAIASTTLGVVAVGAEVGAIAAEVSGDTKTASILGFVGLALGIVAAAPAIAKAATKGVAKLSRFGQRVGITRTYSVSGRAAAGVGRNMDLPNFRNPLANGATSVPGAAPSPPLLSDDVMALLQEAQNRRLAYSQSLVRNPLANGNQPTQPRRRRFMRRGDRADRGGVPTYRQSRYSQLDPDMYPPHYEFPRVSKRPPSYRSHGFPSNYESPPSYDARGFPNPY
ncbi:RHS repeat-associated core domain-containing protein [Stenotrophomonas sp.]|uniref:RHS repeat-associated core domain-containing protein n=1 Tax=Stenotrophomonas sp. TaxID=69392 RepID=UPI0028A1197A|nr:RHS repeat-associated core domain-containing protein [Stenotrophomonas sp.]